MDYQILRFAPKIRDKTKIVVLCAIDRNLSRLVRPLCSTTFMGPTVCLVQNERAVSGVAGRRIPAKGTHRQVCHIISYPLRCGLCFSIHVHIVWTMMHNGGQGKAYFVPLHGPVYGE